MQIVCRALSEALPREVVEALRNSLPLFADLFESPSPPEYIERIDRKHSLSG